MDTQLPTPEDMEELQFLRLPVQILRIQRFRRPVKITPCDGLGYNLNESDDEEYSEHADSHTPATIASASVALLPESSTALLSTSFAAFEALAAPVVSPEAVHFGSSTSSRPVALPPRTTAISSAYTLYAYSDRHPPAPAPAPVAPLCLDPPTLSDPALAFHMSESAATAMAPSSRPTGGGLPLPSIYASNLGFPEDPDALFGIGAAMTGDGGPAHGQAAYPEAADAVARYCYNIMPPADLHAVHGSVFGARDGDSLQQPPPPAGLFAPPLHVPPEYLDMFYNLHEPRHQPQQLAHMRQWEELCQRELSLRRGRLACQPIELVHPQAVTSPPGALPPTSAAAPSQLFGDTRKGSSS
ncbi:hypothetical protein GGI04_005000 [Coemansia thaxteri]|nr:hypothetical protein GGI04_005000 [Coemansia thaxteri]